MSMRKTMSVTVAGVMVAAVVLAVAGRGQAQAPAKEHGLADTFFPTPLPPADHAYGAIDGKHMHEYVVEQAAISRRYRDAGHPQFWGRVIGTSSDAESAQWLLEKFKRIGLTDTRVQPVDLVPQWMPQSWEITATGGDKTLHLE